MGMLNWLLTHTPLLYFTQSLWRDEAFSILAAQRPISFIINNLGIEPPVYYVTLHYWIKLFGTSEIAVRSLSLLGFMSATILVIYWSEKLFNKHWLSWVLPILFFTNPMLLYYAFEVRAYSWYVFFSLASMYGYMEKKWLIVIAANVVGFYTHSYMIFVPLVQAGHRLATEYTIKNGTLHMLKQTAKKIVNDPFARSLLATLLLMAPWFVRMAQESARIKTTWYFPVNGFLVLSVLGNMFLGFEGTPWYVWGLTAILSPILLFLFVTAIKPKKTRNRNLFFLALVLVPLAIVIGVSFFKPLFVNRYLIYVSAAEVFLLAFAIETFKRPMMQKLAAFSFLVFTVVFNLWYPDKHAKVNIRQTFQEVHMLMGESDIVLASSPLVFFESMYYAEAPNRVFLYNPQNLPFPPYVGDAIVDPSHMLQEFPQYPTRAFFIREDGSFDITYSTPVSITAKTNRKK